MSGDPIADTSQESFVRVRESVSAFRWKETSAIAAARAFGIDIGLIIESMFRTPIERVRRNDEILATMATMRGG